jgi:hypothetical protein
VCRNVVFERGAENCCPKTRNECGATQHMESASAMSEEGLFGILIYTPGTNSAYHPKMEHIQVLPGRSYGLSLPSSPDRYHGPIHSTKFTQLWLPSSAWPR